MSRKEIVLRRCREEIKRAAARHRVESISLIGSVARGEDGEDSDIDFLVDFEEGTSLFDVGGLAVDLEEILGEKVDVVDSAGSGERRDRILKVMLAEAIPL